MAPIPQLVSHVPLQTLIETWESDLKVIERCSPSSDGAQVQRKVLSELRSALQEARTCIPRLSVRELAAHTRMPVSTVTNICRNHGKNVGALKICGRWSIAVDQFEHAISGGITSKNEQRKPNQ